MKNNKINIVRIIYILAAIALAVAFLLIVLEKSQVTNFYSKPVVNNEDIYIEEPIIDYSPADPSENDSINEKKESGELANTTNQLPTNSDEPINVTLTAATQDNPGGPIIVRVLLNDVRSGTCNITATREGVIKNFSREVVYAGTYYNCEALDIPVSDLSQGLWEIKVDVTSGDRFGTAKQSVEVVL